MVLGILSIPSCCCGFVGVPLAVTALVLGIISMGKIRREPQAWKGRGMAIAGIAIASVALLLTLAAFATTFGDGLRARYVGSHF